MKLKKEFVVSLSSCEAEYVAVCEASCQVVWLCSLMRELEVELNEKVKLLVDNKLVINLAHHPVSHGRSKHIKTKFHYIKDQVNKGSLEVEYYSSERQLADVFKKPLKRECFSQLRQLIGVRSVS